MPRSPVVARCALQSMTPWRTASPWLSYDQSEVVLPLVVVMIGPSTIEVVLDESDEVLLVVPLVSEVVVLIGPSTIEVVLEEPDEVLLVLPPALLSVLVPVLDEVVPGSDEGVADGVLDAPAETEIVASLAEAWRTAPVPPARTQTETVRPIAAREEIAARSRDGVGMENLPMGGWLRIRRSPQNARSPQTLPAPRAPWAGPGPLRPAGGRLRNFALHLFLEGPPGGWETSALSSRSK